MTERQTAGQRIIASAKEALAFAQGENDNCVVHVPDELDTARIRKKVNMSQSQFAAYFGVNVRTIQEWEQGRAIPSRSARTLLIVIDREPEAVHRALVGSTVKNDVEKRPKPSKLKLHTQCSNLEWA